MTPFQRYLALPGINFSRLKLLRTSPRLYKYRLDNPPPDQPYFRVGRCTHTMVLEPHLVEQSYVVYPGTRRGEKWLEFKAKHEKTHQILNQSEWDRARAAADAVLRDPNAMEVLAEVSDTEVPLTWTDPDTGMQCKGLADGLGSLLMDLKSSQDPDPKWWPKKVVDLGYHIQLAFYFDGASYSMCDMDPEPRLIVVGSSPPHDVIVWRVPPHVIDLGREEYKRLLETLKSCIEFDRWPGQAPFPLELELPDWAYPDAELPTLTFGGVAMEEM